MASFGSFLGTALGTDPQAFQRGAENQLKLQALQRAEQDRLNLKNYAPNQMNLGVNLRDQPNLDSSQFGSDQLFIEPPKKVEPEVVQPIEVPKVEENVTEESTVGDDQVIIDNQETKTPETLVLPNFDADAVRCHDKKLIGFSEEFVGYLIPIKEFLFEKMYRHWKVNRLRFKASRVIQDLFNMFFERPDILPEDWGNAAKGLCEKERAQLICDYIAGMTDQYALMEYRKLTDNEVFMC